MKRMMKIMILLIVTLFIASGCDLADTIEDLTTRDMTVTQTIYDGTMERSARTAVLTENLVVAAGKSKEASFVDLDEATDNIICYSNAIDPTQVFISAEIRSLSSRPINLSVFLVDSETEDQALIGSISIPGNKSVTISNNNGFQSHADDVEQNLYNFFSDHPFISSARLVVEANGDSGASAQIEYMDLHTSPAYRKVEEIGSALIESYSSNIKSINDVSMSGTIENLGEKEFRFLLVIGNADGEVNFDKAVADGYVAPGEIISVNDLLVAKGEARVERAIEKALDGNILESNVFILSSSKIEADINKLKIKTRVTVGL